MHIILIPGLWLDASSWGEVTPALEAGGHRTHALTMPGVGVSGAESAAIGIAEWVAAAVAEIDRLDGPVVLVGHSGGGNPIHLQMDSMKSKLAEIWCFDVVYGNVADWIHVAYFNPTKRVTVYHAIQSLDSLKELVKLKAAKDKEAAAGKGRPLDNLEIIKGGNHHFPCLTDNFLPQAKGSKALAAASAALMTGEAAKTKPSATMAETASVALMPKPASSSKAAAGASKYITLSRRR